MDSREIAYIILLNFETKRQRLQTLIDKQLDKYKPDERNKKFVYNLVSGVIRNLSLFDWKVSLFYKGQYKKTTYKFKNILRLALYELEKLDFIPPHATVNEYVNLAKKKLGKNLSSTVNGILRTYLREGKSLSPKKRFKHIETQIAVAYSFPEWLIKRWIGFWGESETLSLCEAFNKRPQFDLRVNQDRISVDEFRNKLELHKVAFERSLHFKTIFKVVDIQKILKLKFFEKGYCSVQDESGQIILNLLAPSAGDVILDACAAPGGKYTAILEHKHQLTLIGLEINPERLNRLKINCDRLGYRNSNLVNGDSIVPPFKSEFSKILIDAPCSGFGSIQKHPDIKWRRSLNEIFEFQTLQLKILNAAGGLIFPGSYLIYSTCTIDPAENEEVVKMFLESNKGKFELVSPPKEYAEFTIDFKYIGTFPHIHKMDGSFAAILKSVGK